jgi:hypothetical protein
MDKVFRIPIVLVRNSGFGENLDGIWRECRQNPDSSCAATAWLQAEKRREAWLDFAVRGAICTRAGSAHLLRLLSQKPETHLEGPEGHRNSFGASCALSAHASYDLRSLPLRLSCVVWRQLILGRQSVQHTRSTGESDGERNCRMQ